MSRRLRGHVYQAMPPRGLSPIPQARTAPLSQVVHAFVVAAVLEPVTGWCRQPSKSPGQFCGASRTACPSSPITVVGYDVLELFGRLDHVGQQLAKFGFLEWRQASVFLAAK